MRTDTVHRRPSPDDWTVERARDAYLAENGFTVAAYDDAYTEATVFGMGIAVPNTAKHRWAIMLHDLHHVATGYGTDPVGEAEISAWEVRGGLRPLGVYVGAIVLAGMSLGGLIAPQRTLRAWRAASGTPSLFAQNLPYPQWLAMRVGELRQRLGVPAGGLAKAPRALHARAPHIGLTPTDPSVRAA